jgi:hypothetical protein
VDEVRKIERHFDGLKLEHIPRGRNTIADELSQIAAKRLPVHVGIFVERLTKPSAAPKVAARAPTTSLQGVAYQLPPIKAQLRWQGMRTLSQTPLLP